VKTIYLVTIDYAVGLEVTAVYEDRDEAEKHVTYLRDPANWGSAVPHIFLEQHKILRKFR
jgi:hypothetical protein